MKRFFAMVISMMFCISCGTVAWAGEMDVLVNKLVEKGILTPYEGQILIAEAKEEAAKDLAKGQAASAPAWTQKIKISGDIRDRLQVNWGQRSEENARIRNRVRARIGIEGKVNDQISGGVRIATGSSAMPRSTNQTLEHTFEEKQIWFDEIYIKWDTPIPQKMGSLDITGGKFKNPMETTDLIWDGDITPEGLAVQYMSPNFELGDVATNLYSNSGVFLQENSIDKLDVFMVALQAGLKMDIISDWDGVLNASATYYDWSHIKDNPNFTQVFAAPSWSALTNTTRPGTNMWKYDYNLVDVLFKYDAKKIFDLEMGHGLYADMVWNIASGVNRDFGCKLGGYVGDKKVKKQGQWKAFCEWRYLEQDAVPDFLPDSDFPCWRSNAGGLGSDGGTNAKGIVAGFEYGLLKNTILGIKYYWSEPIDMDPGIEKENASLLQMDVLVKF